LRLQAKGAVDTVITHHGLLSVMTESESQSRTKRKIKSNLKVNVLAFDFEL